MHPIGSLVLVVLSIFPTHADPAGHRDSPLTFERLLTESGMELAVPDGFAAVEVRPNEHFIYDHAYASSDGALEVRYAVRPPGRMRVDYEDPHSAAPDPNHIFPLMFQSMVGRLSGGRHSLTRDYPPQQAREKFNADWAAAAVFDTDAGFATDHRQALIVAMHKNALADAYVIFLFDNYEPVKQRIIALPALKTSRRCGLNRASAQGNRYAAPRTISMDHRPGLDGDQMLTRL